MDSWTSLVGTVLFVLLLSITWPTTDGKAVVYSSATICSCFL